MLGFGRLEKRDQTIEVNQRASPVTAPPINSPQLDHERRKHASIALQRLQRLLSLPCNTRNSA